MVLKGWLAGDRADKNLVALWRCWAARPTVMLIFGAEVSVGVCKADWTRQEPANTGAALGFFSSCAAGSCKSLMAALVLVGCKVSALHKHTPKQLPSHSLICLTDSHWNGCCSGEAMNFPCSALELVTVTPRTSGQWLKVDVRVLILLTVTHLQTMLMYLK